MNRMRQHKVPFSVMMIALIMIVPSAGCSDEAARKTQQRTSAQHPTDAQQPTDTQPGTKVQAPFGEGELLEPVTFKMQPLEDVTRKGETYHRWMCTHTAKGKTARFSMDITASAPSKEMASLAKVVFHREEPSESSEFLQELQEALEAKTVPQPKKKVDEITLAMVVLGTGLSKDKGGGYSSQPAGDWTCGKVFVEAGDGGEFFLNYNEKAGVGEISEKDAEYGDIVVQTLSTIF